MPIENIINDTKTKMDKSIASLDHDLSSLRTGRATASLLNPVVVEIYGSKMPISQVATINIPEPRLIQVQVWDKASVKTVEKAIANANLGVNPVTDGQTIRIALPNLSEERRKELAKLASKYGENCKIAIRNIRRDQLEEIKSLEKKKEISEDDMHKFSDQVQKITDDFMKKVDEKVVAKEKEVVEG